MKRSGFGKRLMSALEVIGRACGMKKVMLTMQSGLSSPLFEEEWIAKGRDNKH
jgi:hypothetical protein